MGSSLMTSRSTRRRPFIERFLEKTEPIPECGCWIWIGAIAKPRQSDHDNWYGMTTLGHRRDFMGAHRASWILFRGPIPEGMCVLHRCDIKSCVNPDHLFLGSDLDNAHDMIAKGRAGFQTDTNQIREDGRLRRFLSEPLIREAAAMFRSGMGVKAIAGHFDVVEVTLYQALRGRKWKHLNLGLTSLTHRKGSSDA